MGDAGAHRIEPPGLDLGRIRGALEDVLADLLGAGSTDLIGLVIIAPAALGATMSAGDTPAEDEPVDWCELTRQERAVATLAGQALTNRQIAKRLFISPHTVNYHMRQIFRKLDVRSRVHLARFARESPPDGSPY